MHRLLSVVVFLMTLIASSVGHSTDIMAVFVKDSHIQYVARDGKIVDSGLTGTSPFLSPDGNQLAYYKDGLMLCRTDKGKPRKILSAPVDRLSFAPDGKMIAYETRSTIRILLLANLASRKIDSGTNPSWLGNKLFYEKKSQIWVSDLKGKAAPFSGGKVDIGVAQADHATAGQTMVVYFVKRSFTADGEVRTHTTVKINQGQSAIGRDFGEFRDGRGGAYYDKGSLDKIHFIITCSGNNVVFARTGVTDKLYAWAWLPRPKDNSAHGGMAHLRGGPAPPTAPFREISIPKGKVRGLAFLDSNTVLCQIDDQIYKITIDSGKYTLKYTPFAKGLELQGR